MSYAHHDHTVIDVFVVQAAVYLRWARFLVSHIVGGRQYVVVNVDETALANVRHTGVGMVSGGHGRPRSQCRPRERASRAMGKVTLLGCICDSASLQPVLPQVVLPRYAEYL